MEGRYRSAYNLTSTPLRDLSGAPVLLFTGTYDRGRTYGVELGFAF